MIGVHIELLGQLHQRLLAPDGGKRHFRLECRAVVPARSSRHGLSCFRHLSKSQAEIPLIPAVQISRDTSFSLMIFFGASRRDIQLSSLRSNVAAYARSLKL